MEEWFGLTPTGRQFREPTGVQHELVDADGVRHVALLFDEPWRGHPALTRDVELVRSFLEYPMVVGLVELSHADPSRGVFVYPTGTVWTLKELLRIHADLGHAIGPRAALELCWLTGQVLLEAAENGGMQGCFSHGGLTPWRIALRTDGNLQVIGYGLPQVDVLAFREAVAPAPPQPLPGRGARRAEPVTPAPAAPTVYPDQDSLRYAPPERLTGVAEDVSADTLSLTLVAYEVLTGRPLYDASDPAELHRAVAMSDGVTLLSRPNPLPRDIAQVFARALVFDPEQRLRGAAWLAEIEHLLATHADGEPLAAVVDRVRGAYRDGSRRGVKLRQADTRSFTPDELRDAVSGEDAPEDAPPKPEQRWAKAGRSRRSPTAPAPARTEPAPHPPAAAGLGSTRPASGPGPEEEGPRRRRRRELSTGPTTDVDLSLPEEETSASEIPSLDDLDLTGPDDVELEAGAAGSGAPPLGGSQPRPFRRQVRRGVETGPVPSAPEPVEPDEEGPATEPFRRRRRRGDPAE